MENEKLDKWFYNNREWLITWLDKPKSTTSKKGQWFVTSQTIYWESIRRGMRPKESAEQAKARAVVEISDLLSAEQTINILYSLIWGVKTHRITNYDGFPGHRYTIAGFVAQLNRLPTKKDKVQLFEFEPEPQPYVYDDYDGVHVRFRRCFTRLKVL